MNERRRGQWPVKQPADMDAARRTGDDAEAYLKRAAERALHEMVLDSIRHDLEQQPSPLTVLTAARNWCTRITAAAGGKYGGRPHPTNHMIQLVEESTFVTGISIPAGLPAAAEAYAKAGIKVFRVRRNKTPYANCPHCDRQSSLYVKHRPEDCQCGVPTCHGFWAATTDLDLIHKWWAEEPDANIGAPCKLNGWAVIDIDPRNGGNESYQALEKRVGVLPGTTMQLTGGGGLHLLYRSPDFDLPGLLGPGIDFKHNGYILLAPSAHSSGGRYQWAGSGEYLPPAVDWPASLLPRKQRRPVPAPRPAPRHRFPTQERARSRPGGGRLWTVADLVQHVMDTHEGSRNNAFYFAACRAHELAEQQLIDLGEAEAGLLAAASAVGLTDSEARASFDSASTRPSDRGWVA